MDETESKERVCEHCQQGFTRQRGTAGRYCGQPCWRAARSEEAKRRHAQKPIGQTPRERRAYYSYRWQRNNPERVRATKARYREKHRERLIAERREYQRKNAAQLKARKQQWEAENPDIVHARRVRQALRKQMKALGVAVGRYAMTAEDFQTRLAAQGGGCAICQRTYGNVRRKRLSVDHDHKTGVIRGLLCTRCNSVLGYMLDDPSLLRRAADYLEGAARDAARADACPIGLE